MKKEKLIVDAIKQDLMIAVKRQIANKSDWRLAYMVPSIVLTVLTGLLFKNIFISLPLFAFAAYHIVRYVMEIREYMAKKSAVLSLPARGDVSVSDEAFSHMAKERIYEPRFMVGRRSHTTKLITVCYFSSGSSWRVPDVDKHYAWSRESQLSTKGLENISISGDNFFFVRLRDYPDIAYAYPCKMFEIDASLINR